MSNTVTIQYTKFSNIDDDGREGSFDYGYRIYDDYAMVYNNNFDNFTALKEEVNEDNFWVLLNDHPEFEDALKNMNGINFNGQFYDLEEIDQKRLGT
jgi:hypothetical protein